MQQQACNVGERKSGGRGGAQLGTYLRACCSKRASTSKASAMSTAFAALYSVANIRCCVRCNDGYSCNCCWVAAGERENGRDLAAKASFSSRCSFPLSPANEKTSAEEPTFALGRRFRFDVSFSHVLCLEASISFRSIRLALRFHFPCPDASRRTMTRPRNWKCGLRLSSS